MTGGQYKPLPELPFDRVFYANTGWVGLRKLAQIRGITENLHRWNVVWHFNDDGDMTAHSRGYENEEEALARYWSLHSQLKDLDKGQLIDGRPEP